MWPWLTACAHRPTAPAPPPLPDGAVVAGVDPARAWIGPPTAAPGAGLRVWLGAPSTADGPWIAVPGAADQRSRRARRTFASTAAAGGPGDLDATWRHVDLVSGGEALRLIAVPGDGPDLADAETWLPKVLGPAPTLLVIGDGARAEAVWSLARRHSASLVAVAWPGDGAMLTPEGRFAELVLRPGDGASLSWDGATLAIRGSSAPLAARWTSDDGWTLGPPVGEVPP